MHKPLSHRSTCESCVNISVTACKGSRKCQIPAHALSWSTRQLGCSRATHTAPPNLHDDPSKKDQQQLQQTGAPAAAAAAAAPAAAPARTTAADRAATKQVLLALGRYTPTGLSDGPASLSQVLPYNAAEVQHALQHSSYLLPRLSAHRLANIAAALAAAGHCDQSFMQRLGSHVARRLRTATAAPSRDSSEAALQMRAACFLAVAYARFGLVHAELLQQVALTATQLLQGRHFQPQRRRQALRLALLAASFAALKLHPPQLFRALGELFRQQRQLLKLLGPTESMLLLWAYGRLGHSDAPAQLLLTQRAATQVGQLDCRGLSHAYVQCATAGLTAPPLLAALRKATRQRLHAMAPADVAVLMAALAALGQQDLLLLDDVAKALHNKMAHMSGPDISSSIVSCSLLRYRNPWLLRQAAKMLVSRKLHKACQLSAHQLADLLTACRNLQESNTRLLGHLGTVAAESPGQLKSWTAGQVAVVLQAYAAVGFLQPVLLQAAAARLVRLASTDAMQRQHQPDVPQLIAAAYHLASMPPAGGTAAERALAGDAVGSIADAALQQQQQQPCCSSSNWIKLSIALQLTTAQGGCTTGTMLQSRAAEADQLAAAATLQQKQQHTAGAECTQQRQQQVLQHVRSCVAAASSSNSDEGLQVAGRELLCLMQLMWLAEQQAGQQQQTDCQQQQEWQQQDLQSTRPTGEQLRRLGSSSSSLEQQQLQQQQNSLWRLGLTHQLADKYVMHFHSRLQEQQLQQQRETSGLLLQAFVAAVQRQLAGAVPVSPYRIPGSPMVLPAAVLPAAGPGELPPSKQEQRQPHAAVGSTALKDVQQQQPQQQQQQQRVGLVTATIGTLQQLRKGLMQFDPEVLLLLRDWQQQGVPFAVFADDEGPAGLQQPWCTSSRPQQLLPLALQWEQGLACAGWGVLLLKQRDVEGEAAS